MMNSLGENILTKFQQIFYYDTEKTDTDKKKKKCVCSVHFDTAKERVCE